MASKKEIIVKKGDLNKIVEKQRIVSGYSYKVFEIPKGQFIGFRLRAITDTINIKETQERVYWIAQSTIDFKKRTFLGWKSKSSDKPLHEFLDWLDKTKGKWTDKGVGMNYIKSFEVVDGKFIYKPKSIGYDGSEEGKGIWLEACNYYPTYGSQGAFIIPVAPPYIKEAVVNKMAGQEMLCVYDAKTSELQDKIQYGDFIEFTIKTHNILADDFKGSIAIQCEGKALETIELNATDVQPQFEGTPAYNATYIKKKVYIDLKWIELLGHQENTSKTYNFDIEFTLKDSNSFRHDVDPSKIKKTLQKDVFYEDTWSFNEEESKAIPQIATINEAEVVTMQFEECRYTKLTISHNLEKTNDEGKKIKEKREYTILEEKDGCLSTNENVPTFNLIGGNEPNKINIEFNDLKRVECAGGVHTGKKLVVINQNNGSKVEYELKDGKQVEATLEVKSDLKEFGLSVINNIWPTIVAPNTYLTHIATCRYARPLLINVYPNIEWEIAFILTIGNSYSGNIKHERTHLSGYHKGYGFNYLKKDLSITGEKTGALGFGVKAKCVVNGKEYETEQALKSITNAIDKATYAYNTVSEYLEIFDHKKSNKSSAAVKKGILQLEFNIDPPNIALALGWKYGYANNNALVPIYSGGLKLDPLIGVSIGVDLVPLIDFIPYVGKVTGWIISFVEWLSDSDIYIVIEMFSAIKGELGLSYNKVDGFDQGLTQKVEAELGVALKAGANSNDTIFVSTTTRAGITETKKVEKWKVEGKVATSFSFIEEVGYNNSNGKQYKESSVVWNGAKMTITVYELVSRKKIDYDKSNANTFQLFNKEDIYKSGKTYLDA